MNYFLEHLGFEPFRDAELERQYQEQRAFDSIPPFVAYLTALVATIGMIIVVDVLKAFSHPYVLQRQLMRIGFMVVLVATIVWFMLPNKKTAKQINWVSRIILLLALTIWTITIAILNRPWTNEFLLLGVKVGSIILICMGALIHLPKHIGFASLCYIYFSFTINSFSQQTFTLTEWTQSHFHLTLAFCASIIVYVTINRKNRDIFLARQSLEKQLKRTERAERRKRLFLNAIGHDLKQPLHGLVLYQEMIRLQAEQQKNLNLNDSLKRAQDSAEKMAENLSRLIDIARIDERGLNPTVEKVDLLELLKSERNLFEPLAQTKSIRLKLKCSNHQKFSTFTDRVLIETIIKNLIGNAMRYSRINAQPAKVQLRLAKTETTIRLFVSDNGQGIPKHDQKQMFEQYVRGKSAISNENEGLGLGLHLVKESIENLLGHDIRLRSDGKTYTCALLTIRLNQ